MNNLKTTKNSKVWKSAFFTILIINGAILLTIGILLFWPVPKEDIEIANKVVPTGESSEFVVRTTKDNINDLANAYLSELLKGSKHRYSINLDEEVQLIGELPFFSTTLPLQIDFEPLVQKNGDLILQVESIAVGKLELPNKQIMRYVGKSLPMPEWVIVNADEEEIYVKITDMDIKSNFKVYAEQFDLEKDIIALKIDVPYKTLGIDPIQDEE